MNKFHANGFSSYKVPVETSSRYLYVPQSLSLYTESFLQSGLTAFGAFRGWLRLGPRITLCVCVWVGVCV